jgi:hypothetical protein
MKLASLINLKPLKEEYSSEYTEGDKVKFNPPIMKNRGFEDNLEHYDDLIGVVTKASQDELEIKLSKSIIPPGGGNIDHISLWKSEGDYEMIEKVEPGAFWDVQSGGGLKEWANLDHDDMYTILDVAAQFTSTQHEAANQIWNDAQDLYDYLKSDHIDPEDHKNFFWALQSLPLGADIQDDRFLDSGMSYDDMLKKHGLREEDKELSPYQKSIAAKWDKETEEGGEFDTTRELEKNDTKQFMANMAAKTAFLTKLRDDGKFRSKTPPSDDKIEMWVIKPKIPGFKIAGMLKPEANEGSCGYTQSAPDGKELDTPGGTRGMDADDRTRGMLRKLIQKEIKKLAVGKAPIIKEEYTAKDQWDDFDRSEKAEVLDILGYDGNIILHNSIGYEEILDDVPNLDKKAFDAEILGIPISEKFHENLDDKLRGALGDDDFEKATSKHVPGLGDVANIDDKTNISTGRKTFMQMMMAFTDEPFLIETGLKLYDAWARGEGGLKPSRILDILKDTSK